MVPIMAEFSNLLSGAFVRQEMPACFEDRIYGVMTVMS